MMFDVMNIVIVYCIYEVLYGCGGLMCTWLLLYRIHSSFIIGRRKD